MSKLTFRILARSARLSGVGSGLGLGGGLSFLSGQYGLAVDGFQSLEVVLPSGEIVTASETSYPDLFGAMKGGGGNAYGVVTSYTVTARKVGEFDSGLLVYALNETNKVVDAARDFIRYNTDPKAAIIVGTRTLARVCRRLTLRLRLPCSYHQVTFEKTPLPSLGLNLDEVAIVFAVSERRKE